MSGLSTLPSSTMSFLNRKFHRSSSATASTKTSHSNSSQANSLQSRPIIEVTNTPQVLEAPMRRVVIASSPPPRPHDALSTRSSSRSRTLPNPPYRSDQMSMHDAVSIFSSASRRFHLPTTPPVLGGISPPTLGQSAPPPMPMLPANPGPPVYYTLYTEVDVLNCKQPFNPNNPSLGRVWVRDIPPPRTIAKLKSHILAREEFGPDMVVRVELFLSADDDEPLGDGTRLSSSNHDGPGARMDCPLAIVIYSRNPSQIVLPTSPSPMSPSPMSSSPRQYQPSPTQYQSPLQPLRHASSQLQFTANPSHSRTHLSPSPPSSQSHPHLQPVIDISPLSPHAHSPSHSQSTHSPPSYAVSNLTPIHSPLAPQRHSMSSAADDPSPLYLTFDVKPTNTPPYYPKMTFVFQVYEGLPEGVSQWLADIFGNGGTSGRKCCVHYPRLFGKGFHVDVPLVRRIDVPVMEACCAQPSNVPVRHGHLLLQNPRTLRPRDKRFHFVPVLSIFGEQVPSYVADKEKYVVIGEFVDSMSAIKDFRKDKIYDLVGRSALS